MKASFGWLILSLAFLSGCGQDDNPPGDGSGGRGQNLGGDGSGADGSGGEPSGSGGQSSGGQGGIGNLPDDACGTSPEECEGVYVATLAAIPAGSPCSIEVAQEKGDDAPFYLVAKDSDGDGFRSDCSDVDPPSVAILPHLSFDDASARKKPDCDDRDRGRNPGATDKDWFGNLSGNCQRYVDNNCDGFIDCPCELPKNAGDEAPIIRCFQDEQGREIARLKAFFDQDRESLEQPLNGERGVCEWGYRVCVAAPQNKTRWSECQDAEPGLPRESCHKPNEDWDCNGVPASEQVQSDEDVDGRSKFVCDEDEDGHLASDAPVEFACSLPSETRCADDEGRGLWVEDPVPEKFDDCDDSSPLIYKGARERCDGLDNDCDEQVDDSPPEPPGDNTVDSYQCVEPGRWQLSCLPEYLDCDSNGREDDIGVTNGCERPARSLESCGACGNTCNFSCGPIAGADGAGPYFGCGEVKQAAVGAVHSCVALTDGRAACFGLGTHGELGNGQTPTQQERPVQVANLTSVAQVAVGATVAENDGSHSCALLDNGEVHCWGSGTRGQNGKAKAVGAPTDINQPQKVNFPTGTVAVSLALGAQHSLVATSEGQVYSWGDGCYGQLGAGGNADGCENGDGLFQPNPVLASFSDTGGPSQLTGVVQVTAANFHSCVLSETTLSETHVYCVGDNDYGQLGLEDVDADQFLYTEVGGLSGPVRAIATGPTHTCALLEDSTVECWGANDGGQLGTGAYDFDVHGPTLALTEEGPLTGVTSLHVGDGFTCALTDTARYCWGYNYAGQFGDPDSTADAFYATVVAESTATTQLAVKASSACSWGGSDPRLTCWGNNTQGQLGRIPAGGDAEPPAVVLPLLP